MALKSLKLEWHYEFEDDTWEDISWCESCSQTYTRHLQSGTVRNIQNVAYRTQFTYQIEIAIKCAIAHKVKSAVKKVSKGNFWHTNVRNTVTSIT
jgi:hypothetical protein